MPNRHNLSGCKPTPLLSYLKALGILRVVAEQKDPLAKGFWEGGSFTILSELGRDEFLDFFCNEYKPTPIVSPWNGGSGFYPGDATEGIQAILECKDERFALYRFVIKEIRSWSEMSGSPETVGDVIQILTSASLEMKPGKKREDIETLFQSIVKTMPRSELFNLSDPLQISLKKLESLSKSLKPSNPNRQTLNDWWKVVKKARTKCSELERGSGKETILSLCRSRLPEICLQWVDAICALEADGNVFYNPALGTGGNEGRLDFSNNFMQRISELLITGHPEETRRLLDAALHGTALPGMKPAKVGQYDPGRAGGFNQGMGVETKDFKINPWDFALMLEGTLMLATTLSRRNQTGEPSCLSTPFTVRFSPVGFSSNEYAEKGRNETWLPVWKNPATYAEAKYLFGEGRSLVGRRQARTGLDFSRAVGTLGVDRGIDSFERYVYLERRGKSYVALPAGRLQVKYKEGLELLNETDKLIRSLDSFLREFKNIPASLASARRQIDEGIFSCCAQTDALHFCDLIRAFGRIERLIAQRDRSKKPVFPAPLFGLSPEWIKRCDDGTVEVRIAAALASIRNTGKIGSISSNMAGVHALNPAKWSEHGEQQHWFGSNLIERLHHLLVRRMIDAERLGVSMVPLQSFLQISPHDVMAFLAGETDDSKIEELLWGFSLIGWKKRGLNEIAKIWPFPLEERVISRTWALIKLLFNPEGIRGVEIRREPRIIHLLQANRIPEACALAIHRLKVSELKPYNVFLEEDLEHIRLIASLMIPVSRQKTLESLMLEDKP